MSVRVGNSSNQDESDLQSKRHHLQNDSSQSLEQIYETIETYYSTKLSQYGATPLGVDWTCIATQQLRFVQLLKICKFGIHIRLNDLGCGYGALVNYLAKRHSKTEIDYLGIDVSAAMIARARRLYLRRPKTAFAVGRSCPRIADFSIASGIFNVKLNHDIDAWEAFIAQTLLELNAKSRRGFSVNFMQPEEKERVASNMLYRTTPPRWREFCQDRLDCSVETIANYGLREFTLLVRPWNAGRHGEIS
jgi:SAM-dependent methyltransferase